MTRRTYSLRFEGLPAPSGEISMRDLVDIGGALQLTVTRIARQIGGQVGPGRSTAGIDRISELRLAGIDPGSTVLSVRLGDDESLPFEDGDEALVARRFEESFLAIARNQPPQWANGGVLAALGKTASHLSACGATHVSLSPGSEFEKPVFVEMGQIDVSVWKAEEERQTERLTITGRLDKVDLRVRRFRVRDDVGYDVTLEDVVDVDTAAQLIGQRVVASGMAERENVRIVRLLEPVLTPENLPTDWFAPAPDSVPVGGTIPDTGIEGVTDEEVDEFLAEIRA